MMRRIYGAPERDNRVIGDKDLPVLDRHQLEKLEAIFPPRCMGAGEDPLKHQRYAGCVEMVQNLRAIFDDAHKSDPADDTGDAPDFRDGERAS